MGLGWEDVKREIFVCGFGWDEGKKKKEEAEKRGSLLSSLSFCCAVVFLLKLENLSRSVVGVAVLLFFAFLRRSGRVNLLRVFTLSSAKDGGKLAESQEMNFRGIQTIGALASDSKNSFGSQVFLGKTNQPMKYVGAKYVF